MLVEGSKKFNSFSEIQQLKIVMKQAMAKILPSNNFNPSTVPKAENLLKSIDFVYNLQPIASYSRIFGLIPFSVIRSPNGGAYEARVKPFDILWFIISICSYVFLGFVYIHSIDVPKSRYESYILLFGDSILISLGIFFGAVIIIMDMINRFRIVDILNNFVAFDKNVSTSFLLLKN